MDTARAWSTCPLVVLLCVVVGVASGLGMGTPTSTPSITTSATLTATDSGSGTHSANASASPTVSNTAEPPLVYLVHGETIQAAAIRHHTMPAWDRTIALRIVHDGFPLDEGTLQFVLVQRVLQPEPSDDPFGIVSRSDRIIGKLQSHSNVTNLNITLGIDLALSILRTETIYLKIGMTALTLNAMAPIAAHPSFSDHQDPGSFVVRVEPDIADTTGLAIMQAVAVTAAIFASFLDSVAIGTDALLLVVVSQCTCLTPIQRYLGDFGHRVLYPVSASSDPWHQVRDNFFLLLAVGVLNFFAVASVSFATTKTFRSAMATAKFPSMTYCAAAVLHPGIAFRVGSMLMYPDGDLDQAIAVVFCAYMVLLVVAAVHTTWHSKAEYRPHHHITQNAIPPLINSVLSNGSWGPRCRIGGSHHILGHLRQSRLKPINCALPIVVSTAVAFASVTKSFNAIECGAQLTGLAVFIIVIGTLHFAVQPYRSSLHNVCGGLIYFTTGAILVVRVSYCSTAFDDAGPTKALLYAAYGLCLFRAVVGVIAVTFDRKFSLRFMWPDFEAEVLSDTASDEELTTTVVFDGSQAVKLVKRDAAAALLGGDDSEVTEESEEESEEEVESETDSAVAAIRAYKPPIDNFTVTQGPTKPGADDLFHDLDPPDLPKRMAALPEPRNAGDLFDTNVRPIGHALFHDAGALPPHVAAARKKDYHLL